MKVSATNLRRGERIRFEKNYTIVHNAVNWGCAVNYINMFCYATSFFKEPLLITQPASFLPLFVDHTLLLLCLTKYTWVVIHELNDSTPY
jgi:hypothetical protein